jgi:hypothetical protein
LLTSATANPTLLGLLGFLIPYTSTIFTLCGLRGAVAPTSLIGLDGDYYFLGAIAMNLAGIAEFILGNSMFAPTSSSHSCHTSILTSQQHSQWLSSSSTAATGVPSPTPKTPTTTNFPHLRRSVVQQEPNGPPPKASTTSPWSSSPSSSSSQLSASTPSSSPHSSVWS